MDAQLPKMTSPFSLKPVLDKELGRIANSIQNYLNELPGNYDLAIQFPLSQSIDPKSEEAKSLTGMQYSATIPFAILTPFPKGKLLVAIYDINSEDPLVSSILEKAGIKVVIKASFSDLKHGDIRAALANTSSRRPQQYERLSVGYQQHQASEIIGNRIKLLDKVSPIVLLHEVRASSMAELNGDLMDADELEIWNYITTTSFDCLVVSKEDIYPLLAIEYDGEEFHKDEKQISKDELRNKFCRLLSLPLVRINRKYLDKGNYIDKYRLPSYLQGVIFMVLKHSYESYDERKRSLKHLGSFIKNMRKCDLNNCTSENIEGYLSTEELWVDDYITQMENEYEKERLFNEYKSIYKIEPEIRFSVDAIGRLSASLKVPPIGSKKSLLLKSPVSIRVEIYGVDDPDLDDLLKNYVGNYLLELGIAAGSL